MSAAAAPQLSDDQIVEVLGLLEGADSVELKLTVPASDQRSSIEALGFDPLDAQVRLIYFFDTPDLALSRAGVVVRARRIARKGEDAVVKLRPVSGASSSPSSGSSRMARASSSCRRSACRRRRFRSPPRRAPAWSSTASR